eukprot:1841728-Amphidinium_carterae.1
MMCNWSWPTSATVSVQRAAAWCYLEAVAATSTHNNDIFDVATLQIDFGHWLQHVKSCPESELELDLHPSKIALDSVLTPIGTKRTL